AGVTRLAHPAGPLTVPHIDIAPGGRARVRIRARDVVLAVGEPGRLSVRNRLAARVIAVAEGEGAEVGIRLDACGTPMLARVTRDAVRDLELAPGVAVT